MLLAVSVWGVFSHGLKILGLILLALLLLFLVLLILVLALPIRYEAVGRASPPEYEARGKISFFLGVLTCMALVNQEKLSISVRLFGSTVLKRGTSWKPAPEPEKKEEPKPTPEAEKKAQPAPEPEKKAKSVPEPEEKKKPAPEPEKKKKSASEPEKKAGSAPEPKKKKTEGTKKSGGETAEKKEKEKKPENSESSSAADRAKQAVSRIQSVWTQIHDPVNIRMFHLVRHQLARILRHILPRELSVKGTFGTGDPARTGYLLGLFYMLCPLYYRMGEFELSGDFEGKSLRGRIYFKGRIHPGMPLLAVLRLALDRDIRHFVREHM